MNAVNSSTIRIVFVTLSAAYATATRIHTYDGVTLQEVGIAHSECFLALGFELQPVELYSLHCVGALRRLCPATPPRA